MYRTYNSNKQTHRSKIDQKINSKIFYDIIMSHLQRQKFKKQYYPRYLKELPENHFLVTLCKNQPKYYPNQTLDPFISPNNLLKQYNRLYSKSKFSIAEIYYHYDQSLNNKKFENQIDAKNLFFNSKNQSRQQNNTQLGKNISTLMNAYLNKNQTELVDTQEYQNVYVILERYCPIILMKIKYEFRLNSEKRSGFEYFMLKYDEYNRLHGNSLQLTLKENETKRGLQIIRKQRKNQRDTKIKPEQISKRQQLKTSYSINNFSIGWIQYQSSQLTNKPVFTTYFDPKTLQNNVNNSVKQGTRLKRINSMLFFKKGQYQIPRIQIISFLFEGVVCKIIVKLSDIKKVKFFAKNNFRQIYLYLNSFPQYFSHILDKNSGFTLYNLTPWHRTQNFPVQGQKRLRNSAFMKNMLANNSVVCIDFKSSKNQFQKVVSYFQAQQIIQSQYMNEEPFYKIKDPKQSFIQQLQNKFYDILNNISSEYKIIIHQIKFSLLSLNKMFNNNVSFQVIIEILLRIEKQFPKNLQLHNQALINLCLRPHKLQSKCFEQVYHTFYQNQQYFQKLSKKYPGLDQYQLIKFQQLYEDSISQVSDIGSISDISQVQSQFFQFFSQQIQKTRHVLLPNIKLTPNGMIYAGWSMQVASKILKQYKNFEYQFLKVLICDDFNRPIQGSPYLLQDYIRKQMDTITVIKEQYVPLGWSQSQLKKGQIWYTLSSKYIKTINRDKIINFLGDFDQNKYPHLKNPALKAARIGQNFGSSWSFDASKISIIYQEDILADKNMKLNYSDGIGCISESNMKQFKQSLNLQTLAAVQIRFKGIKGVVSLNKQLKQNTSIIRKSMVKYQCTDPRSTMYFDIIDYSKYKVGYLNRQIIILLIANRIPEQNIVQLQKQYIKLLEKDIFEIMFENISFQELEIDFFERQIDKKFQSLSEIFKMILSSYQNKKLQTNRIIYNQSFFKALKIQAKRKLLIKLKQKCRIRVEKSVRLFGILDEFNVLNEYQVYCSIQKPNKEKQNVSGKCILTKNPCMHPADIRIVTCISDFQIKKRLKQIGKDTQVFQELVNVIVFPQKGKIPLTMEISQSDLDGDEFFLSWDERIVPMRMHPRFVIAEQVRFKQRNWKGSGYPQMLDFFVQFLNFNKLGRLANSHLIQADLQGPFCKQCVELCKTHSIAVQYPKRGYDFTIDQQLLFHMYPHYLQKQHPLKSYRSKSVLAKLYEQIIKQSSLKQYYTKSTIVKSKSQNFFNLINVYVDQKLLMEAEQKYEKQFLVNEIISKHDRIIQFQVKQIQIDFQQNQELLSYKEIKDEYEVENEEFYSAKKVFFSEQTIQELQAQLTLNAKALQFDNSKLFSLKQILTTFNYICLFYYQLSSLAELLEDEHQSIYTIYFELHTSSKNKNNHFVLDRIKQFRSKWLRLFGQQLVNEKVFDSINDFQDFYFRKLIQKKPKFQNTAVQQTNNLKNLIQKKKNFSKNRIQEFQSENIQANHEFIEEELKNNNVVLMSTDYETYTYCSARDLHPLVYRKLLLFYLVSTNFIEILDLMYDVKKFQQIFFSSSQIYSSKNKKLQSLFKPYGQLANARKFYQDKQIDLLGFTWFCLPKLMTVWWRSIVKNEQKKIENKESEDKKNEANKTKKTLQN